MERESYLLNGKRHKTSLTKLIILHIIHETLNVRNAGFPQMVLSIRYEEQRKHELWRIQRNLRYVLTHQLAAYSFCQVKNP